MKQDFLSNLLGTVSPGMYAAGIVISFIGILVSLMYSVSKRDKTSARTPYHFSLAVLWCDNAIRIYAGIVLNVLLTFVFLRFAEDLLGMAAKMIICLGVGLFGDRAFALLQGINVIPSKKFQKPEDQ